MVLGWIYRLLIAVLVVRALWNFFSGLIDGATKSGARRVRPERSVPLVRDPVCGTFVEPSRAIIERAGATVHYFCSEGCRQAFHRSV